MPRDGEAQFAGGRTAVHEPGGYVLGLEQHLDEASPVLPFQAIGVDEDPQPLQRPFGGEPRRKRTPAGVGARSNTDNGAPVRDKYTAKARLIWGSRVNIDLCLPFGRHMEAV